jgi:hypothetical protein
VNFADYNAFRVKVQWLIEGDELENTFSPDVIDMVIALGEQQVYAGVPTAPGQPATPGLRASCMIKPLALTVTDNVATLPDDLLEIHYLADDDNTPVEIVTYDRLKSIGPVTGGRTLYAAPMGDTLEFWPSAPDTLNGWYYQRPADIKDGLHATFNRYPEAFLYGALTCAASVTGETQRVPEWGALFKTALSNAAAAESRRAYAGSRIRIRAR